MENNAKIYVAGHRGMVGSAILRNLKNKGFGNTHTRTHAELDLSDQAATEAFFSDEKPEYVFLAAAKVGGILANQSFPATFIRDNLAIQTNVIHAAYKNSVKRLIFLGSSCIYPKLAPQPMKEEYLLTGSLEATNRPYALAKIAGIEMCWSYNRQFGTKYLAVMPTNLYGPGDNYDLSNSHVIPALIKKFHEAKLANASEVVVWGTGTPRREFLYSEDMADACVFLMNQDEETYTNSLGSADIESSLFAPPLINIGVGHDVTITEVAQIIGQVVGYQGDITFDVSKPDGTPRKLMCVSKLTRMGWTATTTLLDGLAMAYQDFKIAGHIGGKE
ncbi:GDP-L-fucose synthase family protein [Glaciimonas immobilis]|uniref:GDP-L-fucose synthase n=1 Tax=Glaciimonas immobilis TaxID=728004 RepID=A0A840RN69_9BURK|nr:GDP-L-fucose synthase [Glaciimonas immobilis]MBB5199135.1 GDP-L-fucose synthase [Glaciimonas immobilis]